MSHEPCKALQSLLLQDSSWTAPRGFRHEVGPHHMSTKASQECDPAGNVRPLVGRLGASGNVILWECVPLGGLWGHVEGGSLQGSCMMHGATQLDVRASISPACTLMFVVDFASRRLIAKEPRLRCWTPRWCARVWLVIWRVIPWLALVVLGFASASCDALRSVISCSQCGCFGWVAFVCARWPLTRTQVVCASLHGRAHIETHVETYSRRIALANLCVQQYSRPKTFVTKMQLHDACHAAA